MTEQTDVLQQSADPAAPLRAAPLALLSPLDLPAEIALSPSHAKAMHHCLSSLLAALGVADPAERLEAVRAVAASVPPSTSGPLAVADTAIPAKAPDVADFDRYFNVARVQGTAPAELLRDGLLRTTLAVLELSARAPQLPADMLDQQIRGFATYAHLLGRLCDLEPLT